MDIDNGIQTTKSSQSQAPTTALILAHCIPGLISDLQQRIVQAYPGL